jgi:hypothetical protein
MYTYIKQLVAVSFRKFERFFQHMRAELVLGALGYTEFYQNLDNSFAVIL